MTRLIFQRDSSILIREHGHADAILSKDDPLGLLPFFRSVPEFEPGLTIAGLLRCLAPWSQIISRAGWLDFDAWHRAFSTAHLRPAEDVEVGAPETMAIYPISKLSKRKKAGALLQSRWTMVLRSSDPDKVDMGISLSAPHLWITLPLELCCTAVMDEDLKRAFGDKAPTITPTVFETIILGILDGMSAYGSPDEVSQTAQSIRAIVADSSLPEA